MGGVHMGGAHVGGAHYAPGGAYRSYAAPRYYSSGYRGIGVGYGLGYGSGLYGPLGYGLGYSPFGYSGLGYGGLGYGALGYGYGYPGSSLSSNYYGSTLSPGYYGSTLGVPALPGTYTPSYEPLPSQPLVVPDQEPSPLPLPTPGAANGEAQPGTITVITNEGATVSFDGIENK